MKLSKISSFFAVVLLTGACATTPERTVSKTRPAAHPVIVSEAKDTAQVKAAIATWEDRLDNLKSEANEAMSDDRYDFLKKKISKIEGNLTDVRDEFLKMRLAQADDKTKHLENINKEFRDTVQIYDTRYAD